MMKSFSWEQVYLTGTRRDQPGSDSDPPPFAACRSSLRLKSNKATT